MRVPEVQRLRSIRMCNINSLLITGASQISRFEHSLGVVRLAKEWASATVATEEETYILSASAMLHDIKTGPFGHSLEYTLSDNPSLVGLDHQRVDQGAGKDFFQKTDANVSYLGARFTAERKTKGFWTDVAATIAGDGPLGPLISGSIDLDNIDNIIRLAYHVGLTTSDDSRMAVALVRDLRVADGRLSISSASIARAKRWQLLRHQLYRYLLHDWAEFAAKGMLTKAIELATEAHILGTDSWILTDDELVRLLISSSVGENQAIGALTKRIMIADLYTPVLILKSDKINGYRLLSNPQTKRMIEQKMSALLKCGCVFHVILDKAKTDRRLTFYVRDFDQDVELSHDSAEILVGLFASRATTHTILSRVSNEFRREMHTLLGDCKELDDPLEDPFESASEQLQLI